MKAPRATLASLPLAVLAVACGRGAGPAAPPDVPAPSDVAADGDGFGPDGSPHGGAIALDPVAEAWAASIAARPDGGTVAAWVTPRDAAGGTTIVARSFAADDTPGPAFVCGLGRIRPRRHPPATSRS
ncbi:MAG: hypothetical protein FJ087_14845 [Deltaproteobacteria bacterium]|nr:hypothetical protein [Deltaproteobacteria bacterium]